ncbi:MAG: type I 3-dehydroquinate dehydratase [Chthoniobacterales bacterium]|nr:type I 3-dehydroquinate dehydratase [Chthoniobacterales bacterium]
MGGKNQIVGVIASGAALARATRLRQPPDLFELRLDALRNSLGAVEAALPRLRAPLLLTARHPAEGGRAHLDAAARGGLLQRFLAQADLVDLELRSVRQMPSLVAEIRRHKIKLIVSAHHLRETPSPNELRCQAQSALAAGAAIFKVAGRTDTPAQLTRLIDFLAENRRLLPLAVMGVGKLGLESRRRLSRLGSVLTYVSLDRAIVPGQPTLAQLRRARRAYII